MAGPDARRDQRIGPFDARLDADLIRAYADATGDPSPAVQQGLVVPPMLLAARLWEAQCEAGVALVPEDVRQSATGGVHGEHDLVLHRPLVPDDVVHLWVEGHGSRAAGGNAVLTHRYTAVDGDDVVVAEQWWTTVYLGTTCDTVGDRPPDHTFPEDARLHPIGTWAVDVDPDMARRYAQVSDDWSPHHFDADAARRTGFDRVFLHGLCTMALCAQAVVQLAADGQAERLRRVAVRFATPTALGEQLDVRLYDAGSLGVAFEADSGGAGVITNGRAELW